MSKIVFSQWEVWFVLTLMNVCCQFLGRWFAFKGGLGQSVSGHLERFPIFGLARGPQGVV